MRASRARPPARTTHSREQARRRQHHRRVPQHAQLPHQVEPQVAHRLLLLPPKSTRSRCCGRSKRSCCRRGGPAGRVGERSERRARRGCVCVRPQSCLVCMHVCCVSVDPAMCMCVHVCNVYRLTARPPPVLPARWIGRAGGRAEGAPSESRVCCDDTVLYCSVYCLRA